MPEVGEQPAPQPARAEIGAMAGNSTRKVGQSSLGWDHPTQGPAHAGQIVVRFQQDHPGDKG